MIRRRVYPDGDLHMEIGIVLGDLFIRQRHEQPATAFRETVGTEIGGNPTDRSPIPPEGNPLIPFAAFLLKFPKQAGGKNDLTPVQHLFPILLLALHGTEIKHLQKTGCHFQ